MCNISKYSDNLAMDGRMTETKTAVSQKLSTSKIKIAAKKNFLSQNKKKDEAQYWLQKSNLLYRRNPASIVLMKLPEMKLIDVNETALKTFLFSREDAIGKTNDELNIIVEEDKRQEALRKLMKQGCIEDYEMKFRRKDGVIIDGSLSVEIIGQNNHKYLLAVVTNITSRKLAEKAQKRNEEKYRTILETTEEGYYEIDLAGNFIFFNDPVCKLLGYTKKELMGMNNRHYTDKETAKKVFQAFNKVYRTGKPTKEFDWQIIRKDGS